MLMSDGYSLIYDKYRNQIVIGLPQTYATITNSVEQPQKRRVDVEESEMTILLLMAKKIFRGEIVDEAD